MRSFEELVKVVLRKRNALNNKAAIMIANEIVKEYPKHYELNELDIEKVSLKHLDILKAQEPKKHDIAELTRIAKGVQAEVVRITGQPKPKVMVDWKDFYVGYQITIQWGGGWYENSWAIKTDKLREKMFKKVYVKYPFIARISECGGAGGDTHLVELPTEMTEAYFIKQRFGQN